LTLANGLTLNGGNVVNFDLGAADGTHNDKLAITGGSYTPPSSGTVTINLTAIAGMTESGTYDLITGVAGIDSSKFTIGTQPSGYAGRLQVSGNILQVHVSSQTGTVYSFR